MSRSLRTQLSKILGLDKNHRVAIIGAGRLGTALADYYGFTQTNFDVVALFDADKNKIGSMVGDVKVFDIAEIESVINTKGIDVAVIAVPASYAQGVLETVSVQGSRLL